MALSITIDKLFKWSLRLFVFFLPIIWCQGITQNNLQNLFFDFGCLAIFFIAIIKKEERIFINYNIPIIFIYASILTALSLTFSISLLHLLCASLLYYAIVTRIDKNELEVIPIIVMITVWLNILVMLGQVIGIDLLLYDTKIHCGMMGMEKHLAMFLAIGSAFIYSYCWFLNIFIFVILIYLKNITAILGFLTIFLLIYLRKHRITFPVIAGSICIILGILIKGIYKFSNRFDIWINALKDIFRNIFIGRGIDGFNGLVTVNKIDYQVPQSYSELIRAMYSFGLIPFILIAGSVFIYYRKLYLTQKNNCVKVYFQVVMAIIVMSLFQDTLHVARLGGIIVVLIALFEVSLLTKKEDVCCE